MGAVNTTYTFQPTDVITSSKMNDIIDQTTMTGSAIDGSTLQVTGAGQLKVNSQGITSNELAAASVTQAKIGTNVAGTGPAFSATSGAPTSVPPSTDTRIILNSESFDTNNNFAGSRFTPTIAGYYHISGNVNPAAPLNILSAVLYKTGVRLYVGPTNTTARSASVSALMYLNGSTDWVELYASHTTGATYSMTGDMYGFLVRSA